MTGSMSVDDHAEALDDLALRLGLCSSKRVRRRDDLAPVLDEVLEDLLEVEHRGAAVARWTRLMTPNVACRSVRRKSWFMDDLREGVLLQLDDEAHALAVALVAHLADALDPLVADELADLRVRGAPC